MNDRIAECQYLEPSPQMRELQLLELLAVTPERSQSELGELIGLTPARVNAYIRDFVERGYITTVHRSRGLTYHLTPEGRRCLAHHQVTYRAELVRLARAARSRFREFFAALSAQGKCRLAFYGAGETGEVALDALQGSDVVTVVAVIDDDPLKQQTLCHGIHVRPPCALREIDADAVVITSITFGDAIRERLDMAGVAAGLPVYSLAS